MTDEELVAVLRWRGSALQEGAFFAAADRIEQYEEAYQYALHLAKALRENYPLNPDFRFLGDLVGLLTQIDNMVAGLSLTTERDAAYARGYSDAETEISKSALGQSNAFLHSQYANAKLRIEALTVDRAEARAGWHKYEGAWMTAEGKLADAEALIEAQAKDHASNNIRFAEAEHRAKTAEADIAHLHKLLAEAASDLTAYVDAEYPPDTCAQYPDIAKRHFRDMDLVRRIEAELKGESHDQCA